MEKVEKKQFGTNGLERKSKLKLTIGAVLQATDSTMRPGVRSPRSKSCYKA